MEFKVGDKVRVVKNSLNDYGYNIGDEGKVIGISEGFIH